MNEVETQTQAHCRARPIRIAFFVELSEASHPVVDEIFNYSHSIWAGRFSLIVPCKNGEPLEAFIPWLRGFDPDVIYSYVDLTSETQLKLHEMLYPSLLQYHSSEGQGDRQSYVPRPSISPLAVTTLLPIAGAPVGFDGTRGCRVIGAMGSLEDDRFLRDSFGVPQPQLRNTLRSVLADAGSMILVVAESELHPRPRYVHGAETTLPGTKELLTEMAKSRRILGVSQLSALFALRPDIHIGRWRESFNLVIGDTIDDRILYWNSRSFMSPWRDGSNVDLCVPRAKFEDPDFVNSLREFMKFRNHVNGDSGGGPNRVTLRSISLDTETLSRFMEQMKHDGGLIAYDYQKVSALADCVPGDEALKNAMMAAGHRSFHSPSPWVENYTIGRELRMSVVEPEHLRYVPPALVSSYSGAWALDLDIERSADLSPYSNIRHRWRLPRRLRVTGSFIGHYQLRQPLGEIVAPRVSSGGLLTLFATADSNIPPLRLPTDHEAIVTGYQQGRDWMVVDSSQAGSTARPQQLCHEVRRSGAGRYFWGVYQMFGDLNRARSILLHEFWRNQFASYGATDQRTDARHNRIETQLRKRLGVREFNLADAAQLRALSNIVLQEADAERLTTRSLDWARFQMDFDLLVDRYATANEDDRLHLSEERKNLIDGLREAVQHLCNLGILHQGYEHKCRKCLHRSWISISDLGPELICEVCHDVRAAPVDKPWQFRLNGFFREALQRYGVGPLFWVLSHFQRHNKDSFWFEGPLDVFLTRAAAESGKPETDIDLTMIDKGLVTMCEVKQSERQLKNPIALARTMIKLRPDIAMIAVMERDNENLQRKYHEFATILKGSGIRPQLLTLEPTRDISTAPYF